MTDVEYRRLLRFILAGLIVAILVNVMAIAVQVWAGMWYVSPANVSAIVFASFALWLVFGRLTGRR